MGTSRKKHDIVIESSTARKLQLVHQPSELRPGNADRAVVLNKQRSKDFTRRPPARLPGHVLE